MSARYWVPVSPALVSVLDDNPDGFELEGWRWIRTADGRLSTMEAPLVLGGPKMTLVLAEDDDALADQLDGRTVEVAFGLQGERPFVVSRTPVD